MQTVVNPVQVVSDFLKSPDGQTTMRILAEQDRCVVLGCVDGVSIMLERDGFKAVRGNGSKEQATAYDAYDCFAEGKTCAVTIDGATAGFRNFVMCRMCLIPA